jgi:lipoprotein-releasing system permease protein
LKFELFVSRRLISEKDFKSSISAPIIKIATAAISVGVIMMLIAFGTGLGLQEKIRDKIAAFNGHIQIHGFTNQNQQINLNSISKNQDFYPKFSGIDNIEHVQAVATKYGIIRTEEDFEGVLVKGVGEDYKWNYFEEYLVKGNIPDLSQKYSKEILLSQSIVDKLKLKLNDQVVVYFLGENANAKPRLIAFDLVGIYNSGFKEFDDQFLIADLNQIQRINDWDENEIGNFEIFVSDFSQLQNTSGQVYREIDSFLNATSIIEQYPSIFEWLSMFDMNIALIIGIMILVAGINMITALLVLILERTQMIGILKALGSTDWSIRKIFLYNAGYIILKGLFWGNLIGLGLLFAQKYLKLIPLNPETYYVTEAPISLQLYYIIGVNLGTMILCLLMLIIPSLIISKISPIKAMQFD